jgi:hypothetical protein
LKLYLKQTYFAMHNILIFLVIFTMNPLPKETIKSVELSYITRGTNKNLLITPDSIVVSINDDKRSYKTTATEWHRIITALKRVNLKTISTLKRPSTKSFSDGAMSAQLRVESSVKKYESTNFDDNKPPLKLVGVIETMKSVLAEVNTEITF